MGHAVPRAARGLRLLQRCTRPLVPKLAVLSGRISPWPELHTSVRAGQLIRELAIPAEA